MTTTIHPESLLQRRREALRRDPHFRFLGPEEFGDLGVSGRQLERADDASSGTLGLRDEANGITYLVEVEKMLA